MRWPALALTVGPRAFPALPSLARALLQSHSLNKRSVLEFANAYWARFQRQRNSSSSLRTSSLRLACLSSPRS